jgi:hypothetical protein
VEHEGVEDKEVLGGNYELDGGNYELDVGNTKLKYVQNKCLE